MKRVITLSSDFGMRDAYVGAMKGVILSLAPGVQIVDISHEIEPGRVDEAAFLVESFYSYYPPGTIHLVIVDPGVGSPRRALAVESAGSFFLGPDNGVFEPIFRAEEGFTCYEISRPEYHLSRVSRTFHGRDIFAPAAAHLARGVKLEDLGPRVENPVRLELGGRKKKVGKECLSGHVVHVDRFGNLITDITAGELDQLTRDKSALRILLCGVQLKGMFDYYSQASQGQLLALVGSSGRLEVAASGGSAVEVLGREAVGAEVIITKSRD